MSDEAKKEDLVRDANRGRCTWSGCTCTDYEAPGTAGGHCQNRNCQHGATWHEMK